MKADSRTSRTLRLLGLTRDPGRPRSRWDYVTIVGACVAVGVVARVLGG